MLVFLVLGICVWDVSDVGVFGMLLMLVFLVWGICIWDIADVGVFSFGYLCLGRC